MSFLTRLSLAHRTIVGLITVVILGFGLIAMNSLKQELLPSMQQPGATIVATFAGASPASVEREVTEPIERAVKTVSGVTDVQSTTVNGSTSVQANWDFGQDSEKIVSDIRGAIGALKSTLPAEVTSDVYAGSSEDIPVMQLAVASEGDAEEFAKQVGAVVLPALRGIDGVRQVDLAGQNTSQLVITLRQADLTAKHVSAEEVMAAIRSSDVVVAAGTSVDGSKELAIEVGDSISAIDDVKTLPIQHKDGPFPLTAVADVEVLPSAQSSIARADGLPSLSLMILKTPDANAVQVAHAISAALPGLEKELGDGAKFTTVFDQSPLVEQSIHDLSVEGGLGLLFAVLVILVFLLSMRSTIITAVSIPLSLLIALIGLWIGDFSLNIFTLAALTVAVGRVVDDSIVVIENIKRRHSGAAMTVASVVEAVREVAGAVTASTITTVAVFLPIAFVGGTTGELFRPFAMTVTIALLASLLVSLTIVPVLAYWFMRGAAARSAVAAETAAAHAVAASAEPAVMPAGGPVTATSFTASAATPVEAPVEASAAVPAMVSAEVSAAAPVKAPVDAIEGKTKLQRGYLPVLRATLRHPAITILVATAIFVGTIVASGFLKMDFLGQLGDETTVQLTQELPVGTSLTAMSDAAAEVEAVVKDLPGVSGYLTTIGGSAGNVANFTVMLGSESSKDGVTSSIKQAVKGLDGVGKITVGTPDDGLSGGGIEVQVQGDDVGAVAKGVASVEKMMGKIDGLDDVKSDLADEQSILKVKVDRAAAARYGFTQEQIGQAISDALRGTPVGSVVLEGTTRDIVVRTQRVGNTPAELAALPIPVSPLQQAAAQKTASDLLAAEQDAAAQQQKDEANQKLADQEEDLRTARADAQTQLDELLSQLDALSNGTYDPSAQSGPPAADDPLAGLKQSIDQLRSSIEGMDEQLDAIDKSREDAAAQEAENAKFKQAQEDLANVNAVPILVQDVAQVVEEQAPAAIKRTDGVRTVTVTATSTGDDLGSVSTAIQDGLDTAELPNGVSAQLGGVSQEQDESFAQLGVAMLVAIALVYIVMVATFKSLMQPLILLVSVPFAATGAITGLLVTGTPLGLPAMIGLLMLIGIVVTNAIVLIDLVNSYRARGDGIDDAVIHGARLRLRPIIMTACATIFALLPMSIGLTGGGVFISQSLAIVVIGGLVSSTLLTLILVPVLYTLMERSKQRRVDRRAAKAARKNAAAGEEELGSIEGGDPDDDVTEALEPALV